MDKTLNTGNKTATDNVFIQNSTGNKLLQRELIKKEVINSIDVNIMLFFHPSGLQLLTLGDAGFTYICWCYSYRWCQG